MPRKARQKAPGKGADDADIGPGNGPIRIGDVLALRPDELDRRTRAYRRFDEIRSAIYADCGGKDTLSETRLQVIDRFVMMCVWSEAQDAAALAGADVDLDLYSRVTGHARRLAETIGLDRVARDVTPNLADYLRSRAVLPQDSAKDTARDDGSASAE